MGLAWGLICQVQFVERADEVLLTMLPIASRPRSSSRPRSRIFAAAPKLCPTLAADFMTPAPDVCPAIA